MNTEHSEVKSRPLKVKFQVKVLALVLSVISLSWFFEGMRQIKQSVSPGHIALLVASVLSTFLLLWVQAFWIYLEEKSKGTLKKKVAHFDKMEDWLKAKAVDKDTNV
jgi:hypothetical protein